LKEVIAIGLGGGEGPENVTNSRSETGEIPDTTHRPRRLRAEWEKDPEGKGKKKYPEPARDTTSECVLLGVGGGPNSILVRELGRRVKVAAAYNFGGRLAKKRKETF